MCTALQEELGIYTERRPLLNQDSLLKMEQRVAKVRRSCAHCMLPAAPQCSKHT